MMVEESGLVHCIFSLFFPEYIIVPGVPPSYTEQILL